MLTTHGAVYIALGFHAKNGGRWRLAIPSTRGAVPARGYSSSWGGVYWAIDVKPVEALFKFKKCYLKFQEV